MYRIVKCSADTFITNKIIKSTNYPTSRSIDANVGQASSLALFKLYNETLLSGSSGNVFESSRALVKFDYNPIRALTSSILSLTDNSFKCLLSLKDVYSGQTTPSNYTLEVFPLAKNFNEGRGSDVVGFRDLDNANWITASYINGITTLWTSGGAGYGSFVGDSNADYYTSGTLGTLVTSSLCVSQSFSRGDEDLNVDITRLVSASLVGLLPDYGFLVKFSNSEETDNVTRFVKKFGSRHIKKWLKHPTVNVIYNESIIDNQQSAWFNITNSLFSYNFYDGNTYNFTSNSIQITGSNSVILRLLSSHSITYWTSSFSQTHSQSINHLTSSYHEIQFAFTGSQYTIGNIPQTGIYYANVNIPFTNTTIQSYISGSNEVNFVTQWESLDGTIVYTSGSDVTLKKIMSNNSNVADRNFFINITNLKTIHSVEETVRLRVFIQNYDTQINPVYLPENAQSDTFRDMWWRLIHAITKEEIIPFERTNNGTKLSSDGDGMYFDMYMADLEPNQAYEFQFLIREKNQDYLSTTNNFRFRVVE